MAPRLQINDDDLAQVWADGMTMAAIAARMGCHENSIRARVRYLDLTPRGYDWARKPRQFVPSPPKPPSACCVPGCGADLYHGNTSSVCRAHNHTVGFCRCPDCGGPPKRGKPAVVRPSRPVEYSPEIFAAIARAKTSPTPVKALGVIATRFRLSPAIVQELAGR